MPLRLRFFRFSGVAWIFTVLLLSHIPSLAQQATSDTSGYETQRQKVNELLQQRSARFGQFDESLKKRTGIFGLKTKKDMQSSIDILKQIVMTDNNIFRETKMLLDYKDFEKSQIAERATEFDGRINGYIKTISKLQRERERFAAEVDALEKTNRFYEGMLVLLGLTIIGTGIFLLLRRQKLTKA